MPYAERVIVLPRIGLTLPVLLFAAACAGGGSGGDAVLDFQTIAVSGPDVVADPSGTAAVLEVETSIDAICAVAFGSNEPAGRIATDRDMDAGGHRSHRVLLADLEPDTEYRYRLQGVGANGALYRSEVFTFRTPAAPSVSLGENLALGGAVVDVSSEFSDGFVAANALDGSLSSEWASRGDGSEAFISVDLGSEVVITSVVFRTRQMSDGTAVTTTFSVTGDDGTVYGPFPAGAEPVAVELTSRVVRFDVVESTGGNTGAVEIEVYGSAP